MGITGRDRAGERLRELLSAAGITDATLVDDTRPTTTKTRVMAR
jgi:bifunctional ADP-heptose synthase (sugar kinase/adenylyltransferase)